MYSISQSIVKAVFLIAGIALLLDVDAHAASDRNILLIIADDVGFEATTLYPIPPRVQTTPRAVPTPNLSRLAQRGILFRNSWANTNCSPTRATIFTGRYGFRTGVGTWLNLDESRPVPVLPIEEFSLAEAFAAAPNNNYVLAHIGKWHLSRGSDDPNRYGWPYFAGPDPSRSQGALPSYFSWPKAANGAKSTSTTYATTDVVNEALGVINRAEGEGRPWFLWVAFNAAHSPYHKPPNELHSRDSLPETGASERAYYEAMIEALDTEIGRLLTRVDLSRTTIIYLGDNGTPGSVIAGPYKANHAKGTVYEDGIRVPFLIAGAGVEAPGRIVNGLANTVDLFPTILKLAGIDPAAVVPSGTKIDGVSLLPYINNTTETGSVRPFTYAEIFFSTFTSMYRRAIRNARYKLIEEVSGTRRFFDLQADPFEKRNLLGTSLTLAQKNNLSTLDKALDALLATR